MGVTTTVTSTDSARLTPTGISLDDLVCIRSVRPKWPQGPTEGGQVLVTERLFLRPIVASDFKALHRIMHASQGTTDSSMDQTRAMMDKFVPPPGVGREKMVYAVCLKQAGTGADQCGEMIGHGGIYSFQAYETGWPELGYILHNAYWGKGYATEFLRGFLEIYAALPRPAVLESLWVNRMTLSPADLATRAGDGMPVVEEKLTAIAAESNAASQAVLRKAGFTEIATYVEETEPCPMHVYQVHPVPMFVEGV